MISRAERRRRVAALKGGKKMDVPQPQLVEGGIKIGDKIVSMDEVQAIVQAAQEDKNADELATQIISAYTQGAGVALNLNLILGPEDVKQLVRPEHPRLPYLLTRVICEDARIRAMSSLGKICEKIRAKMPEEAEADIPPEVFAMAAEALAKGDNVIEGPKGEVTGALDVKPTEDEGQIGTSSEE